MKGRRRSEKLSVLIVPANGHRPSATRISLARD
jgi:hypothetical protein